MVVRETTPWNVNKLYMWIRATRPGWFWAACRLEPEDYVGFEKWVLERFAFWIEGATSVVFVRSRGHVAECHVALLDRVHESELVDALLEIEDAGYLRVEVPLVTREGRTIRRLLKGLGFRNEGTFRADKRYFDTRAGCFVFLDTEIWARLSEGELNG